MPTGDAENLVGHLASTVSSLEEGAVTIGRLLQAGQTEQGMNLLALFADGLQEGFKAQEILTQLSVDVGEFQNQIQPYLEEIIEAAEKRDYVTVADLTRYELAPRLKEWHLKLSTISV